MKGRLRLAAGIFLLLSAILLAAPRAAAQTAAELERVLALPVVSYGDAAWAVLGAAGTAALAEDSPDAAYRFAADNKWLPKKTAAEMPATLGGVSFLLMKALNIKGGFMYSLFPGPRYAYRELAYKRIIRGRVYSTMTVSGERLLRILNRALDYSGDTESLAAVVETPAEAEAVEEPVVEVPVVEVPVEEPVTEAVEEPAAEAAAAEPEIPVDDTPVIPPEEETSPPVQEERERLAEVIHTELEEKSVADTEVRATTEGITISLNNIQFLPDSTKLTEGEKQKLQKIAAILNELPGRKILVGGHAAMAGSVEGRMKVSTDRAQAVADYLAGLGGWTGGEITVRGYGAERPLGDPATAEGQALNRRVEITLLDEGSGG